MTDTAPSFILHHYDASPFSQKVRMLLGLEGADWLSVLTPNMMPKPDLVPLTGGYRRAPVMQIGADIYCDSQVIMAEIDRRMPGATIEAGSAWQVNLWADRLLFQPTVAIIFGQLGDQVDPAFIADRERLSGRPFDVAAMGEAVEPAKAQWRAMVGWIDTALAAAGTPYLNGEKAGIADLAAFMNIWFLASVFPDQADELTHEFGNIGPWRIRMAAIGEGQRSEIDAGEALDIAAQSTVAEVPIAHESATCGGLAAGDPVVVMADDYGRDPIAGELVAADHTRSIIRRDTDELGTTHVHFPRAGFVLLPR